MEKEKLQQKSVMDEILGDFAFYQHPDLLKEEYRKLIDMSINKDGKIDKYFQLLSNINFASKKILKYELYFSKFYVSSGEINNIEALNHHIHAYLQDMDTLKNKIKVFFDELKKDLKDAASNKKEVVEFIDAGIEKTFEVFEGILKYRRTHVHHGTRFTDGDLLKAEMSQFALEIVANPVSNQFLNKENVSELVGRIEKNKEESFEVAKNRWIKMAKDHNYQIFGFVNDLLKIVKPSLYQLLNMKSIQDYIVETPQI